MRKAILSLVIAVTLMSPFCCYGYNNLYTDTPEIWLNNDNISVIEIEDDVLDGYLQYYADSDSHTLYGHIGHSGNTDSNIPVLVGLENDFFSIEFDENGINDSDFRAGLTYQNNKNEVYFAVDFKNKDIRNSIDKLRVTICIDGVVYLVCEQIAVDVRDAIKTTAPKQTTTKPQKAKAEKESTAEASSAKSSSKKETTTKFKYTLDKTETEPSETVTEPNTENTSEPAIITSNSDTAESHLSPTAIVLLTLAVLSIAVGTALIIRSKIKSAKAEESDDSDNRDEHDEIIEEDPNADHMRKINIGKDLTDYDPDDLDE